MENPVSEKMLDGADLRVTESVSSATESGIDLQREKEIIHKVDIRLLPILGALYSVALVDRINMGSANVGGMAVDLKLLKGDRYSIALLIFFVPYFIFELPSNILLRKVGAARWLSGIVVGWGTVMMGMGFIESYEALVVCRFLLGLLEAGFFPACVYIVSCWYVRYEVQKRLAFFFLISVVIGGLSNILAYGLMQMDGRAGIKGWRWIFIIEGLVTCVLGLASYFIIIDFPDKVRQQGKTFLTAEEIEIIKARIDRDREDSVDDGLTWAKVGTHLSDLKLWAFSFMFIGATCPAYAVAYFLPIMIRGMGFSVSLSQCLSAPPAVAAFIFGIGMAAIGDRMHQRGIIIVVQAIITIIGLVLVGYGDSFGVRYFGMFLATMGGSGNVPAVLSYQSNNIRSQSKRSVGSALQVGFGAIGGIYASTTFRQKDAPKYMPGLWAIMASQFLLMVLVAMCTVLFRSQNKKAVAGKVVIEGLAGFLYTL